MIGGTSLAGGVGSVAGAVMGAFIMSALDNGMSMMDVATFWQYIVKGSFYCSRYGWIPPRNAEAEGCEKKCPNYLRYRQT